MHTNYVTIGEHIICMCGVYSLWVKLIINEMCLYVKLVCVNITVG
jgi:hypothetical protein